MSTSVAESAIKEQATAWLARRDRGFDPAEAAAFNRWCSSDPRHAEAVASLEAAWELFDHPRTDGTSDLFRADLRDLERRQTRRRMMIGVSSLAAACLAVLLWQQSVRPVVSTPAEATAQVSQPERQTLPDGSIVELKRGAAITVDYSGAFRRVLLQKGEAHFQVVRNHGRAFIVTAGGVEVRAVGTAFSVDRGQAQVEVVVTEGRVAVSSEVGDQRSEDKGPATEIGTQQPEPDTPASAFRPLSSGIFLDAGHRVMVDTAFKSELAAQVISMSSAELMERVAWRLPRLEFTDTTIAEAVTLFNRNNRMQLRIAGEDLARLRVSGVFRSDNIEGFVGLLEKSFGVHVTRTAEAITLQKER